MQIELMDTEDVYDYPDHLVKGILTLEEIESGGTNLSKKPKPDEVIHRYRHYEELDTWNFWEVVNVPES